ncbi:bifunctional riboflavin kinase/FAD synthetase [Chitinimonas sp. BJYL2]|uniref:bifunctional riboflavin kinase/FAD synthetase n=1 Tax=Chitinimonas sp. BJYL2 TaxID=2976696 RepID=UPI0022B2C20D|nr:bifunctional riboflavin kinase/FAD synthetase [Chitinimonas sp. BJYL2]
MQVFRGLPFRSAGACALTIGNFDGLHLGHRAMLERLIRTARERGLPAAVLTFEPHPRELFTPDAAPARLSSLREKLELLRDAGVDRVYLAHFNRAFASLDTDAFARDVLAAQVGARHVLVGDDFRFGKARAGDTTKLAELGQQHGFSTDVMHEVALGEQRVSSTSVRTALAAGDMAAASRLLGRPYSISGRVKHGRKLGREIGFPTANIQVKHNRPPVTGIFVVEVHGLGAPIAGAASLGLQPTVDHSGLMSLEVHLLDFSGDIYGQHLRVDFLKKLRDEIKYEGLDPLIAQIRRDVDATRAWFRERQHSERIISPRP